LTDFDSVPGVARAELPGYFRVANGEPQVTVHAAFATIANACGNRSALITETEACSYLELEAASNRIAAGLIRRGVAVGDRVGLYLPRGINAIAAMLGALKAGAAFVPLDPSYPEALLAHIYSDAAPKLLLADAALRARTQTPFWTGDILDPAQDFTGETTVTLPSVGPDSAAYVMYTSGSTGRPKGVAIPHRAILRLVIDNDYAEFGPEQVMLQLAPLAFDASTFEIWGALLHGARLAIVTEAQPSLDQISAAIARHGVTTCWFTAGLFHLMVDHQLVGLKPLRQLLAGGDVLSVEHVAKALQALPGCRLINGYGPTENTTFSCCYTIPHEPLHGPIPIGRAIRHCDAWVLDDALQPVADGVDGELYVGGPGVGLGYLNRPELNAERFIADPFNPGARLYRTGDRVRRRVDGNLEFLGRADRQVKISGKRVELDEIEAVLRHSGLVGDAAVISDEHAGQRRIAAFVTALPNQPFDRSALSAHLRHELPDYMQPAVITPMAALPLSPTGKVDRRQLVVPANTETTSAPAPGVAFAQPTEKQLLAIWRRVLDREAVGLDDNFFDLGGSSLQMLKVHAEIQASLSQRLTIVDLFTYPTIRALAAKLAPAAPAATSSAAAPALTAQERARRAAAALAGRPRPPASPTRPSGRT